jgi:hypothetical protein
MKRARVLAQDIGAAAATTNREPDWAEVGRGLFPENNNSQPAVRSELNANAAKASDFHICIGAFSPSRQSH